MVDERDPYAYALRALVRLRMGETRDAWADAETVALLGRATDGYRGTSAVVDAFAGDTARVRAKLRPFLLARGHRPRRSRPGRGDCSGWRPPSRAGQPMRWSS
jgi:hypothetical protein